LVWGGIRGNYRIEKDLKNCWGQRKKRAWKGRTKWNDGGDERKRSKKQNPVGSGGGCQKWGRFEVERVLSTTRGESLK